MRRIYFTSVLAIPLSFFIQIFERYIFSDWDYLKFLVVLIILDTVLGFIKHWLIKDVSSKAYGLIAKKLIIYSSVMILANVCRTFTIAGESQISLQWFSIFCCTMLMVRESLSIVENIEIICPGTFPLWIIKRLKDFDNNTGIKQ